MHVTAVVAVGARAGQPDILTPVVGVPMLVRSLRGLLAVERIDRVLVLSARPDVRSACAGLPVSVHPSSVHDASWRAALAGNGAHGRQRAGVRLGDGPSMDSSDDVVLLHDGDRPLTPPGLIDSVLAAVRDGHDTVVPVLPLADTVKIVDRAGLVRGTPDRAGLRVVQAPRAIRLVGHPSEGPSSEDLFGSSHPVHTVPGHPLAFAVTSAWDLELAELLVEEGDA